MRDVTLRTRLLGSLAGALTVMAMALVGPGVTATSTAVAAATVRGQCAAGQTAKVDAIARAGGGSLCLPLMHPETMAETTARQGQFQARFTAPFRSVAPGAFDAGLRASAAIAPAGTVPGSGAAWAPYGRAPMCAGHTNSDNLCPLPNTQYPLYPLGFTALSGRVTSFAYDTSQRFRYFASPVGGGVWETRDGAKTWVSIGDRLPDQTVGAIAYDVPLHRVLAGSGDNAMGGGTDPTGHGIFYSDDDGASWHRGSGVPDNTIAFKVVVAPRAVDPTGRTVYFASGKGLYKSHDGGVTWVNTVLPTSPPGYLPNCAGQSDVRFCYFASIVTDVVVKGTTTANGPAGSVMAVVGWRAGQAPDLDATGNNTSGCTMNGAATPCQQAPRNGLYISPSGEPGTFQFQDNPSGFAPNNIVGRTSLGIAHGNGQSSDAVFALVQDAQKIQGCLDVLDTSTPACNKTAVGVALATNLDGAYATYDFGKTWTKIMDYTDTKVPAGTNTALVGLVGYSPGIQAWYNNWIEPDPTVTDASGRPSRVLFGLEEIWENNLSLPCDVLTTTSATCPGTRWVAVARYWNDCAGQNATAGINCNPSTQNMPLPGTTVHPDQHAALFIPDPGDTGVTLLAGSDGGAFIQHVGPGKDFNNDNWSDSVNNGLFTLQPYDAEIAKDGTVVTGNQDNGAVITYPDGKQAEMFGGDGFFVTIDPNNSKHILEEYTYGVTSVTLDGGLTWQPNYPATDKGLSGQLGVCAGDPASTLFSTPLEQDPLKPGHVLEACTTLMEATNVYQDSCIPTAGGPAATGVPVACVAWNTPFTQVFDLKKSDVPAKGSPQPSQPNRIPSALALVGPNAYAAWCGYCDVINGGQFDSGIATNVGGSKPPKTGTGDGWHLAAGKCAGCGTKNGLLPRRYINSIQEDPSDPNTVFVTLGGYGRVWVPPGSFGDPVDNVGQGHLFVSHDHGENFTDISGNLPDVPATWAMVHKGQLVVGTYLGMFVSPTTAGKEFAHLGTGLPPALIMTIRDDPANPNRIIVSTYGRGVYQYTFGAGTTTQPSVTPSNPLPNTAAIAISRTQPYLGYALLIALGLLGGLLPLLPRRLRRRTG